MIRIDRKVLRAVRRLTDNYHDEMRIDAGSSSIQLVRDYHQVVNSIHIDYSYEDILEAVHRLTDAGYLKISKRMYGGFFFCMTSLLKHRRAFWWDSFTKKFWCGFAAGILSGVIITVLGGLLLSYLRAKWGI